MCGARMQRLTPVCDPLNLFPMTEITFQVEPCKETGGYVARWDAPQGGGITTQGDSFAELDAMIGDAVGGCFEPKDRPKRVRLHFSQDPILAVA